MPAKPQYIRDLVASVDLLSKDVQNQGQIIDKLEKASEALRQELKDLTAKYESLKDTVAEFGKEAAVTTHKAEALTKRMEESERRWWTLLLVLVGAVFSLAAGLIVTLVRR